jgi:hypothetical protein
MAQESTEPLFHETDGEERPRTWKDAAMEEDRAKLHEPGNTFDRLDDQAQQTAGMAADLASGMSYREASRHQTAEAARQQFEGMVRKNDVARTEREAQIQRERHERLTELLGGPKTSKKPDTDTEKQ